MKTHDRKTPREEIAEFFVDWYRKQPYQTQKDIWIDAALRHGFIKQMGKHTRAAMKEAQGLNALQTGSDGQKDFALLALYISEHKKLGMPSPVMPLGRCGLLTAKETAQAIGVSRRSLFRMVEDDPALKNRLGYTGTNERNGRYALRAVYQYAVQGLAIRRKVIF